MTRKTWERQFTRQIKLQLGLEPEQIRFHWKGYFNQRFTSEQAITHLKQTHELYPSLGILSIEQNAPVLAKLALSPEVRP